MADRKKNPNFPPGSLGEKFATADRVVGACPDGSLIYQVSWREVLSEFQLRESPQEQ